jgi:phosphohistidine phosphatase
MPERSMKKIIFVRHGRAEDGSFGISDFERSLTTKGKIICREMALRFRGYESSPQLIITSPAFRALETALIFAAECGIKPDDVRLNNDLYFKADMKYLLEMLALLDDNIDTVTLFGHNPSFTEFADRLCSNGCEFMTKTSIVCISFKAVNWKEIKFGSGKLEYFLKPDKL